MVGALNRAVVEISNLTKFLILILILLLILKPQEITIMIKIKIKRRKVAKHSLDPMAVALNRAGPCFPQWFPIRFKATWITAIPVDASGAHGPDLRQLTS